MLAADVPGDVTTAGHGYVTHLGGEPVRVRSCSASSAASIRCRTRALKLLPACSA